MAEQVLSITPADLSRIQRAIESTAAGIAIVDRKADVLAGDIARVDRKVEAVKEDLANLQSAFNAFVKEQRNANNLQFAATEIVRIRQELDEKFGKHADSRIRLRGILDSTDAGLLREHTVHSCSEQIMLDTPKYWLAPCLVALAAWISREKDLAEKAVTEAIKRDATKTTLLFALICRRTVPAEGTGKDAVRQMRLKACFKWLNGYFRTQNPLAMSDSVIVVVDSWANNIFGEDTNDVCGDTFRGWMQTIEKETDIRASQTAGWKEFYQAQCVSTRDTYPVLASVCPEFVAVDEYLCRINSASRIQDHFDGIRNAKIDKSGLIDRLDDQLNSLISEYDEEEEDLRIEEKHFDLIKQFKGDEYNATIVEIKILSKKHSEVANFAERLQEAVRSDDPKHAAARKTAIQEEFLGKYISSAYTEYITEKKETFPEEITLQNPTFDGWKGKSTDGQNKDELTKSYTDHVNGKRAAAVSAINRNAGAKVLIILAIIGVLAAVVTAVMEVLVAGIVIFAVCLIIGIVKFISTRKAADAKIAQLNQNFDQLIASGTKLIVTALEQWAAILAKVTAFAADSKNAKLELEVPKED